MRSKLTILIFLAALFAACQHFTPSYRQGMPNEFSTAYEKDYGHYYDSVPFGVVCLDIYSDGLEIADGRIVGTGYNLCLTDIFVPDSLLETGTYRSDTTVRAFTFLPGRDYEGTPHGIYLLDIQDGTVESIQVMDSGSFVMRDTTNGLIDLKFTLYYKNSYGGRATYRSHFQGTLLPWAKQ